MSAHTPAASKTGPQTRHARRERQRSPYRSATKPQRSSVTCSPTHSAASRTPDLRQRQLVLVAERRREHGQREPDVEKAACATRAGGEHGPAVARTGVYRPNGLIGCEPVVTSTLFVSR